MRAWLRCEVRKRAAGIRHGLGAGEAVANSCPENVMEMLGRDAEEQDESIGILTR